MKPIWRIFKYIKYYPWQLAMHVLCNTMHVLFNLSSFVLIVPFIELLFGMGTEPTSAPTLAFDQQSLTEMMRWGIYHLKETHGVWGSLLLVSVAYLAMVLLSNLFRYLGSFFVAPIRHGITQHLRDDVYSKVTILPVSYFNSRRRGDVISRLSNDLLDVEWSCITTITAIAKEPINILFFAATLLFISAKLCLYFVVILPVALLLIIGIGKSLKRNSNKGQAKLGILFSHLDESLNGIKAILSFGRERHQQEQFRRLNDDYTDTMVKVVKRREISSPLSEVLGTLALVSILILGGSLTIKGEIASSVFILFVIIFLRLIPPVQSIVKAYNNLQKGNAAASRFFQIIDADETILQKEKATVVKDFHDRIEYDDVSFAYTPDETGRPIYVLKNLTLSIPKGSTTAIVGPSGSGKTTMMDLLPRFYDCTAGCIKIDGTPIKEMDINSLRSLFGLVSQECILFNDTIANNIAFGRPDMSIDDIRRAARLANAEEFICQMPEGYDTQIGDRGMTLSGGQRQRISIARALLKNPPILILDEATSALDAESEVAVQQALEQLMKGRTCLVIAHRLSTIKNADDIIVLSQGQIAERGTHTQLSQAGGLYQRLIEMQTL